MGNADLLTVHAANVLTAYTGILCGPFPEFHRYAEELLGRPVMTHEFAERGVWDELKEAVRPEFLRITSAPEEVA